MKKIAIQGHPTRGREIIEILEMLGGVNEFAADGNAIAMADNSWACYTIDPIGGFICIIGKSDDRPDSVDWKTFTLEEFIQKFPYKIGDMVRVAEYESEVRIDDMKWDGNEIQYEVFTDMTEWYSAEELNLFNQPLNHNHNKNVNIDEIKKNIDNIIQYLENVKINLNNI